MRFGRTMAAFAVVLGLSTAAFAMAPMNIFSGHYYRIAPTKVKKRLIWPRVNDIADVAPIDSLHAFVRLDLRLGGASCHFAGVARIEREELVYRDLKSERDQTRACSLVFTRENGSLAWSDNGHCSQVCSSGLTGTLPASHRGAAPGAKALSRSGDYSAAVEDWRSSGGH